MNKKLKRFGAAYASLILLAIFTVICLLRANYEFLFYAVGIFLLIILMMETDKIFKYSQAAKWGVTLASLLHFLGGTLVINGKSLYSTMIFGLIGEPFYVFKFDQFIHFYGYFVFGLFAYAVIKKISTPGTNKLILGLIMVLVVNGVGALNEVQEFCAFSLMNATGVGDYVNNALDLVFNLLGSIVAISVITLSNKK